MSPFVPRMLPRDDIDWASLVPALGRANRNLARYDATVRRLLNPDVLLSPLRTREAVLSSRIEGTVTSQEELFAFEADPGEVPSERRHDIIEVLNYRAALDKAIEELRTRPISLNMIRRTHAVLMAGVRGQDKRLGDFRREQNYIALPGAPISEAIYVPPADRLLPELLDNFERYIHFEEKDRIAQAGLVHAQFELIHPFLDGNGRVGRILIPIFLFAADVISQPFFYVSEYLETHRDVYFHSLKETSRSDDMQGWLGFFLEAVAIQAENDLERASRIHALYDEMKERVAQLTRSQFAIRALDVLFTQPIFSGSQFVARSGVTRATASRLLAALVDGNVLEALRPGRGRRVGIYAFRRLLAVTAPTASVSPGPAVARTFDAAVS